MNNFFRYGTRKLTSFITLFTMIAVTIGTLAPFSSLPAQASPESGEDAAVHIATVRDLEEFSKNCTTDSWSVGRTFVLDNDIDLSGTDFTPIPTFGGIFYGQGHAVKGLSLNGGSDYTGLFRYIQESGEVHGLTVSGTADAKNTHTGLALLAGCNYGLISDCNTQGNVTGGSQAASVAGLNDVTGVITNCTAGGVVYGRHVSGGIAGLNKGSILNCANHSFVNTTASDNNIDLASIDVEAGFTNLLTTENAASVTDIGGIAGTNSGIIRACTNDGSVGYQHVGYNIGGIAGSQTGYIEGCINYGLLNGRKDVGGIAGQMEPSSELIFSEDTLQKLDTEFDKLHDLLSRLDSDASSSSSRLTGQVDRLLNSVEGAQRAVDEIMGNAGQDLTDFSDLTDLAVLPSPKPVSLDFLDKLPKASFTPWPSRSPEPSASPSVTPGTIPEIPEATPTRSPSDESGASPSPTPTGVPAGTPVPTSSPAPTAAPGDIPEDGDENISAADNVNTDKNTSGTADTEVSGTGGSDTAGTDSPDATDADGSDTADTGSSDAADAGGSDAADTDGSDATDAGSSDAADADGSDAADTVSSHTADASGSSMQTESGGYILMPRSSSLGQTQALELNEISATDDANTPPEEAPAASPVPGEDNTVPSPSPSPTRNPFEAGWMEGWPTPPASLDFDSLQNSIDRESVEQDINEAQQNIYEDASHVLERMQNTVRSQASILSSRIFAAQNSLSTSFSAITSDMRLLNSMLDDENQIILNDFQAIIDELGVISDIITDPQATDPDDILTDISDEDEITDTTGKVMNCINNGKINGDLNTGGIAGSLSRENNLDPEDDFDWGRNDLSLNFRYKERIVVRKCQNTGAVNGKKNHIGGIAGEMTLGSVIDCINSGNVSSDGDMIGGIVGYSASTIRQSSAKCTLSGISQIGGIAGYASGITDCYSMVNILDGETYLGSIAGKTDSDSALENNFFVLGCPAGVDGISYEGRAQALSYEEFMEAPDLPDIFKSIYLTFTAQDKTVAVITLEYGDTLRTEDLPSVPAKEGCIGKWSDFNSDSITFDQQIEAVYSEYAATIESTQTVGQRPILLVEGRFDPEDALSVSPVDAYPEDAVTRAQCWKVSIPGTSAGPYRIRYLIPADMENPQIEILKGNTWVCADTEKDGSYYVFTCGETDLVLSCVDRPAPAPAGSIILLVVCGAAFIILLFIIIQKKRKDKLLK